MPWYKGHYLLLTHLKIPIKIQDYAGKILRWRKQRYLGNENYTYYEVNKICAKFSSSDNPRDVCIKAMDHWYVSEYKSNSRNKR